MKLAKYVRKKASRAARNGKTYRPTGKDAIQKVMMVAVAEQTVKGLKEKMRKTDKVAKEAVSRSRATEARLDERVLAVDAELQELRSSIQGGSASEADVGGLHARMHGIEAQVLNLNQSFGKVCSTNDSEQRRHTKWLTAIQSQINSFGAQLGGPKAPGPLPRPISSARQN